MEYRGMEGRRSRRILEFRSLQNKLLTLLILLSLLPLFVISSISYYWGIRRNTENLVEVSLKKMARDTADKMDLVLRDRKEAASTMAATLPYLRLFPDRAHRDTLTSLLNEYCFNHDFYDVLMILDAGGNVYAMNTVDRLQNPLPPGALREIVGGNIRNFPDEKALYEQSINGQSSHLNWYSSGLVRSLYDYPKKKDICFQYNIAFSEPIWNPDTREVVGVWINILNWEPFQRMLDVVEEDLKASETSDEEALSKPAPDAESRKMVTGYAFMFSKDGDTIIGHKYRAGRDTIPASEFSRLGYSNLYGLKLVENLGLRSLHDAVLATKREGLERNLSYEFPAGNGKVSWLSPIEDNSFGWVVGVGIDNRDFYGPIRSLSFWLFGLTGALAVIVAASTYAIARGITVPLNTMIVSAQTIAKGNLNQRIDVRTSDEVGILGNTFNEMAHALETRERQLQELNRNLEIMVRQRTTQLEKSHDALKQAYVELQSAQEQLVQTEKMASLGQLVAGIAHEIKNPLNFIYGNTGFLADYTAKLQQLIEAYENLPGLPDQDREAIEKLKDEYNYGFIREDLRTLIDNFTEGARRINTIVSDLRTFSRVDTDSVSEFDIHGAFEISLNLLRNQYKNRITIHKEYGSIPKIQGYAGKLNQVFLNLLSNAFHSIRETGDVYIRTRASNGMVEIEIADTGVGIAKENLNRIFEPFFTTKPVGQGTGLGLSISYGIIQQHRGKIQVTSELGKGTSFTVRLPVFQEKGGE